MHTDELDLKARTWVIPASRSKNKHAHTVPLSEAAIAVIEDALADALTAACFPTIPARAGSGATLSPRL